MVSSISRGTPIITSSFITATARFCESIMLLSSLPQVSV